MRVWAATSEQPSRYAILAFGEPAPKRLGCERSERESQPKRRPTRTPSDQCDQVTKYTGRERSEWPSTEVPSVPRRLRPDPNTVLNFVVKARMNIRANKIDKTVPGF